MLSPFDQSKLVDVDELSHLVTEWAFLSDLKFDISTVKEALKTKILLKS